MNVAIIGAGPAGLRAAEVASADGASVTLFDAKPSVGRKFLVAGRGGLNLTKTEPHEDFVTRYSQPAEVWESLISDFNTAALREWAAELGIETFAASTGRVYPRELKAAPLLRRWVQRLRESGVRFAMNHRLTQVTKLTQDSSPNCFRLEFTLPDGTRQTTEADAVILALGGGSWPQTGSDGAWVPLLQQLAITVAPLQPANCGWEVAWPLSVLLQAEGKPMKNLVVRVNQDGSSSEARAAGELLITAYGLEGGALYQLGAVLRSMTQPEIAIDLKPSFSVAQLVAKLGTPANAANLLGEAQKRWRLSEAAAAVLEMQGPFASADAIASAAKACILRLIGPRPIAEAISSAGGVCWSELTAGLMVKRVPGLFVAGEMIDWEAPTGGYLIHGCFSTGTRAGSSVLEWLRQAKPNAV